MSTESVLIGVIDIIKDLLCMIGDNNDEFIKSRLQAAHERLSLLQGYLQ